MIRKRRTGSKGGGRNITSSQPSIALSSSQPTVTPSRPISHPSPTATHSLILRHIVALALQRENERASSRTALPPSANNSPHSGSAALPGCVELRLRFSQGEEKEKATKTAANSRPLRLDPVIITFSAAHFQGSSAPPLNTQTNVLLLTTITTGRANN